MRTTSQSMRPAIAFGIVGKSASQDFPVSGNAYQPNRDDIGIYYYDATVSKFSSSGVLLYSTFLGGGTTNPADQINGNSAQAVAIDAEGNA